MNEKHRPIYQATDEDKAFNERIKAELENGDIPKGPQPEVHIDARRVSSLGGNALMAEVDKENLQALLDNSGQELKVAMDKAAAEQSGQNWTQGPVEVNPYTQAAGRGDAGGSLDMMQGASLDPNARDKAQTLLNNSPQQLPVNPTGWEQK